MNQIDELNQILKERDSIYNVIANQSGLSQTSFHVLYFVRSESGEKTQAQIADDFFYPRQSVNSACSKLVKEGLIELVIQKTKGHHKIVKLTEKGEEFCKKWVDLIIKADTECFNNLSKKERLIFLSLYHKQMDCFKSIINESEILKKK